jgi:hypothetical protein
MSAQQFLDNALDRIGDVFFGADYDDVVKKPSKTPSKPNPYSAKPSSGNFSGQSRNVVDTIKDKIKSMPGSQPAKPNPYAAKPTGQLTQKSNGILNTVRRGAAAASSANPYALAATAIVNDVTNRGVADGTLKGKPGVPTKPVGPIQPRIERKPGPWDEGYVKPNTTMEPTEKATLSEYLNPGRQILPQETTTENVNGVVQTGKDLSGGVSAAFVPEYANSSFNDLLAAQGNERYSAFSSNQLPTTQANPFSGTAPKTDTFNPAAPGITGATYDNYGADGGASAALPGTLAEKDQFNPSAARIEGGSSRRPGGSLSEALADTAGINSYMDKFSSGDRERAAGMAFLNGTDSYDGLRKRDAVNGVVYAGGQHYIDGGEGNPAQKLEDPQNARDIASGKAKAQDFLQSRIDTTVDTQKQTPSEAQDPLSAAGSAVKSGFAAGAATDFALNNQSGAPQTGVGRVVPTDQIPKDLTGAAGKKYLEDLDAGRLFN